ncbi:hypothetical protein HaLaN_32384, partial [Haematococcus lacustris]
MAPGQADANRRSQETPSLSATSQAWARCSNIWCALLTRCNDVLRDVASSYYRPLSRPLCLQPGSAKQMPARGMLGDAGKFQQGCRGSLKA